MCFFCLSKYAFFVVFLKIFCFFFAFFSGPTSVRGLEIASAFAIVFAFPKTGGVACTMGQCTALSVATTTELTRCNNELCTRCESRRARCGQGLNCQIVPASLESHWQKSVRWGVYSSTTHLQPLSVSIGPPSPLHTGRRKPKSMFLLTISSMMGTRASQAWTKHFGPECWGCHLRCRWEMEDCHWGMSSGRTKFLRRAALGNEAACLIHTAILWSARNFPPQNHPPPPSLPFHRSMNLKCYACSDHLTHRSRDVRRRRWQAPQFSTTPGQDKACWFYPALF